MQKRNLKSKKVVAAFNKAVNKVANNIVHSTDKDLLIGKNKTTLSIGEYTICKNGVYYDISHKHTKIYSQLYLFSVALNIVQRLCINKQTKKIRSEITNILELENRYSKHFNDLQHYTHIVTDDEVKVDILRHRVHDTKMILHKIQQEILSYNI